MVSARRVYLPAVVSLLLAPSLPTYSVERSTEDVVRAIADGLEQSQIKSGPLEGSWLSEELFAGPATAGMVCVYEWLGDVSYHYSAWRAGDYIQKVTDRQGDMLGDEAYAFVRLSGIFRAGPPPGYPFTGGSASPDIWRSALQNFYRSPRAPGYEGSTTAYLRYFDEVEPSTAVFYLAHHVVAVYYVGDQDKDLWRDAMIRQLAQVDDASSFPVTALGAATWALAKIGGLKADVPVVSEKASSLWKGVVLADLPALLLRQQVPEGEPFAGSFYWHLDHTSGGLDGFVRAGYTEDTIYGVLGLAAVASCLEVGPVKKNMTVAITAGRQALLQGVDETGQVYTHLSQQGETYHAFAGEMLEALWTLEQYLNPKSTAESSSEGSL